VFVAHFVFQKVRDLEWVDTWFAFPTLVCRGVFGSIFGNCVGENVEHFSKCMDFSIGNGEVASFRKNHSVIISALVAAPDPGDLALLVLYLCLAAFCSSLVRTWSNLANVLSSIPARVVSSCAYRASLFAWMASNLAAAIALRFCWKGLLWLELESV
jgi:hypothetical protein